ncbi:MAG: TonB-dependent receptor [Pyrinomonadaceae bacterium]
MTRFRSFTRLSPGLAFAVVLYLGTGHALGQPSTGTIRGNVVDPAGASIVSAFVKVSKGPVLVREIPTTGDGSFAISALLPGNYAVTVSAAGFKTTEVRDVRVVARNATSLELVLSVAISESFVPVGDPSAIDTDPAANASATILKGDDIKSLPADRAELEAALQALAGPGSGPGGGEIFIDGFSGGKLPPRDTIREVRINQNPFSSEFDRLGLGRIEIFTKPGTEDWKGEIGFEFEDESLNSRNPFSENRPSFQQRIGTIDLSGPIIKKKASFAIDIEHERLANNSLINAIVLDSLLNPIPFRQSIVVPTKSFEFSSRVDAQLGTRHTAIARYSMFRNSVENSGLGGFDLPTRGFRLNNRDDTLQITDVFVVSPTIVNESRFQHITRGNSRGGGDSSPTIRVLDAFTSGGANVGLAFSDETRFEFQNYTSFVRGSHNVKAGLRLRHNKIDDSSPGNFAGTFTFTSLEQYRSTVQNLPGAVPTQFIIAGGEPLATVARTDAGLFFQDDWRYSPRLTLSFGLRYENQTNISSQKDLAPRFGFAFAVDGGGKTAPKTVVRGGIGLFYERFGENLTLHAARFNGVNQQQFIVTDPAILDAISFSANGGVSDAPTAVQLAAFAQLQTTRIVSPGLRSPRTVQTVFSIERQLPGKTTLSTTFVNARISRLLRSRNLNAPVNGIRPNPATGNIFQYESTAHYTQNLLTVNFRTNFIEEVSLYGNYSFGRALSDSDGAGSLAANPYSLEGEYSAASTDIRHRVNIGGNIKLPWQVSINPFITFRTGIPFNITTGADNNADSTFNDRPAIALDSNEPGVIASRFGLFDPTPEVGDTIIPRNFGRGSDFFNVNLGISKEFGFGGGGKGGDEDKEARYKIEISAYIRNLLNHTNAGTPVGNLSSRFFGLPVGLGGTFGSGGSVGNRRTRLEIVFGF